MTKSKSKKPVIDMPSKEQLDTAIRSFPDEELDLKPEVQEKIDKLIAFFSKTAINYNIFNLASVSDKKAYPNTDQYMYIPGQHNTQKWLQTVKEIYYKERNGVNRVNAIRQLTSGWKIMETYDFLNWLKYYEEGAHLKYKFAQLWYENGAPGYFLHVKPDAASEPEPKVTGNDIDFARETIADEMPQSEKKQIIEKQRNKIIGRLDSAEKLLRSTDGQIFSGKEFETLLEAIYQLKKKIQMVNKVSTSTRIYDDLIVREANVLQRNGFIKAAEALYKIAQTPAASGEKAKGGEVGSAAISPAPAAGPTDVSGAPGGLPSTGPGMPQPPASPPSAPNETDIVPKGISEFLEGMETSKFTTKEDAHGVEDDLEVEDYIDVADADSELLVTEAQAVPPAAMEDVPITDAPAPTKPKPMPMPSKAPAEKLEPADDKSLEVTEDDIDKPMGAPAEQNVTDLDSKIDAIFTDVTMEDIVAELEAISQVYRTRELPRRLARVDMMLDSKGISAFFPSLSEATNKALEANNYIATRIEDILSKLRGALKTKELNMDGKEKAVSPEMEGVKENLKSQEEKEKNRKQMRKDQESQELEGKTKETPEVEITEDLGAPTVPPAKPAAPVPPPV